MTSATRLSLLAAAALAPIAAWLVLCWQFGVSGNFLFYCLAFSMVGGLCLAVMVRRYQSGGGQFQWGFTTLTVATTVVIPLLLTICYWITRQLADEENPTVTVVITDTASQQVRPHPVHGAELGTALTTVSSPHLLRLSDTVHAGVREDKEWSFATLVPPHVKATVDFRTPSHDKADAYWVDGDDVRAENGSLIPIRLSHDVLTPSLFPLRVPEKRYIGDYGEKAGAISVSCNVPLECTIEKAVDIASGEKVVWSHYIINFTASSEVAVGIPLTMGKYLYWVPVRDRELMASVGGKPVPLNGALIDMPLSNGTMQTVAAGSMYFRIGAGPDKPLLASECINLDASHQLRGQTVAIGYIPGPGVTPPKVLVGISDTVQ